MENGRGRRNRIQADLRKIPVRQETIEICERFDLNPYRLFSEGALLIGTQNGAELELFCRQKGIPAAVIGKAVKGNDRLLYSGENCRYLERPAEDELTKFPGEAPGKIKACFRAKIKIRKAINERYTELKTWHLRKQESRI